MFQVGLVVSLLSRSGFSWILALHCTADDDDDES